MIYALAITIAAGLLLLALLAGAALFARRAAEGEIAWPALGGWRWYPSALGFSALLLVAGLLLSRLFPAFLFLPIVIPFFWWRRRWGGPGGRRGRDDRTIEGRYRPLDDQ
jgi:hypothetical protein